MVMLAGFALIGGSAVFSLYLSYAVARTSSWSQGTLEAFGVGFVVGGVVDLLAISGLNSVVTGEQKLRQNNLVAQLILESPGDPRGSRDGQAASGAFAKASLTCACVGSWRIL
jgi:hypothetical protein